MPAVTNYEDKFDAEIVSMRKTIKGIRNLVLDKPTVKKRIKGYAEALDMLAPLRDTAANSFRTVKRYEIFIGDGLLGTYGTPYEALCAVAEYFEVAVVQGEDENLIDGPTQFDSRLKSARRLLSKIEGLSCKM